MLFCLFFSLLSRLYEILFSIICSIFHPQLFCRHLHWQSHRLSRRNHLFRHDYPILRWRPFQQHSMLGQSASQPRRPCLAWRLQRPHRKTRLYKNDESADALAARHEVLAKQVAAQSDKVELLRAALDNAATSFGENDKRTQNWRIQLNNAEATLNDLNKELNETEKRLEDVDDDMGDTGDGAEELADDLDEAE